MTSLATLVDPTLVERLGWTLVHSLWQGVLIAAVSGILFFALRGARAHTRYLVACASLMLVVASAAITFSMIAPAPDSPEAASTVEAAPSTATPSTAALSTATLSTAAPATAAPAAPVSLSTSAVASSSTAARAGDNLNATDRPLPLAMLDAYERATTTIEGMLPSLVTLWIVGLCFCSIRLLGGLALVARLKRHHTSPASHEWQQRLAALAGRMHVRGRDAISLRVCVNIRTAAVIGWLRPVILVPASALAGLTPQQMEAVLAHELAHIRRHDYLVNLLQSVVETLFFYHPAVWYLSRRVRLEREHCCDDDAVAVVGDPLTYVAALTDLELLRQGVPTLAMAANGGSLLHRIQRLLAPRSEAAPSWSTATGLLTLAVVFAVLATAHGSIAAGLQPESSGIISGSSAIDNDGQWPVPPPPPARRAGDYPPPPVPPVPPDASMEMSVEPPDVPAPVPALESPYAAPMPPIPPPAAGQRRGLPRWGIIPPLPARAPEPPEAPEPPPVPEALFAPEIMAAPPAPVAPRAPAAMPAPPAPAVFDVMPVPPAPRAPGVMPVPPAPRAFGVMPAPPAPPAPPAFAAPPAPEAPAAAPAPAPAPMPAAAPTPRAAPVPASPAAPQAQPAPPSAPAAPAPPAPPAPPPGEGGIERAMNWIGSWFDFPEGNRWTVHDGNRRFTVRSRGDVDVTDDDADIRAISDGGFLIIEEKIGWDRTRVDLRQGTDGRLQRTFYRNGKQVAYEPEGRAWLAKKVPDLVRNSGFGAEARVRRIHTAGGPAAVLAEVTQIKSSYVKRLYLSKLLDLRTVQGPMLSKLIAQAGQEITSDYERTELLREIAKDRLMTTDEQRLAYTVATRTINSSYEHRRALQPLFESGPLADQVLRSALDSASTIESDYELTELLISLGKFQSLTPGATDAYVAATITIDSDYELRRALTPALATSTPLPSTVVRDVLKAAHGIDSDYEMAQFLIAVVAKQKLDDTGRVSLFTAIDSIHSDYERGRVLKAIAARPGLEDALVLGVIESTRGMNSAYEAANVLRDVADNHPLSGNVRKAFVAAADRLSSNHERDRVLVALVKTEGRQ
jgi:beta-lactamase regulating signal transducer with metallopeptidase domain